MEEERAPKGIIPGRLLLAAALLAALVCGFCGGWFAAARSASAEGFSVSAETRALPAEPAPRLNINTADAEALKTLYGIGDALAERIVAYREEHGPFEETYEIMDVSGIGPATFEQIRDLICTETEEE